MDRKESEAMVHVGFKVRKDQKEFLDQFRKDGGNPSQLIRIGIDNEKERRQRKS